MIFFNLIFYCSVIIQLGFYLIFLLAFFKLKKFSLPTKITQISNLSIVICAHNELSNLKKNLLTILTLNHKKYEVVIVDHGSNDGTKEWLLTLQKKHSCLKYFHLKKEKGHSKKQALQKGVEESSYNNLLFTDADCKPLNKNWANNMSKLLERKEIVIGFSGYSNSNDFLLNQFIQFDTLYTAIQYFSAAVFKIPYMGVGRNIAYQKKVLIKNSPLKNYTKILSGDDDLTIKQLANKNNVGFQLSKDSQTLSLPPKNWNSWIRQKIRHSKAGFYYKKAPLFLTTSLYGSAFIFYFLLIDDISLIKILIALTLVILKTTVFYLFSKALQIKFIPLQVFSEVILSYIFYPLFRLFAVISKRKIW